MRRSRTPSSSDSGYEWVSVREAAERLGISPETVRRRIEAGELVGEREALGGSRERFRVRMETPQDAADEAITPSEPQAPEVTTEASGAATAALGLLGDALAEERAERQRLVTEARVLAERAASAEARAAMLEAELTRLHARRWYDPRTW